MISRNPLSISKMQTLFYSNHPKHGMVQLSVVYKWSVGIPYHLHYADYILSKPSRERHGSAIFSDYMISGKPLSISTDQDILDCACFYNDQNAKFLLCGMNSSVKKFIILYLEKGVKKPSK